MMSNVEPCNGSRRVTHPHRSATVRAERGRPTVTPLEVPMRGPLARNAVTRDVQSTPGRNDPQQFSVAGLTNRPPLLSPPGCASPRPGPGPRR
jgi:hypothetical protein